MTRFDGNRLPIPKTTIKIDLAPEWPCALDETAQSKVLDFIRANLDDLHLDHPRQMTCSPIGLVQLDWDHVVGTQYEELMDRIVDYDF